MCLNPIVISNNRRDYYRALHPSELEVPCNECEECVRQRRSDIALRSAFECKRFDVGGKGSAVMVLLTYSNDSVPYLPMTDQMCFNRQHIKLLNDMLRAYFFSTIDNPTFSYLIGAEYGIDERYTQRPHYHGLYFLSSDIDPHDFMCVIRQIWSGRLSSIYQASHRHTYRWIYGNLGFVLPFDDDVEHDYIVKSADSACLYCAKYAVKQVGFYNKPAIQYFLNNDCKHQILNYLPKVWLSRGFGKTMIKDSTFDIVSNVVINPYSKATLSIPRAINDMVLYHRLRSDRKRPVFDPVTHKVIRKKDGTIRYRWLYDRVLNDSSYAIRHKRLDHYIDNFANNMVACGALSVTANMLAIYHYVYRRLPIQGVMTKYGIHTNFAYWCQYDVMHKVYEYIYLHRASSDDTDNIIPVYRNNNRLSVSYLKRSTCEYVTRNVRSNSVCVNGIETFDALLNDDFVSLYEELFTLNTNFQHQKKLEFERKYKEQQLLRSLVKGTHPC